MEPPRSRTNRAGGERDRAIPRSHPVDAHPELPARATLSGLVMSVPGTDNNCFRYICNRPIGPLISLAFEARQRRGFPYGSYFDVLWFRAIAIPAQPEDGAWVCPNRDKRDAT